jgi:hypothetical protein
VSQTPLCTNGDLPTCSDPFTPAGAPCVVSFQAAAGGQGGDGVPGVPPVTAALTISGLQSG